MQAAGRNNGIDIIKGIAIIAVVLYHIGLLPYGYLGVDAFLVISGYFLIKSMLRQIEGNTFNFWLNITVILYQQSAKTVPLFRPFGTRLTNRPLTDYRMSKPAYQW